MGSGRASPPAGGDGPAGRCDAVLVDLYETLVSIDWGVRDRGRASLALNASVDPDALYQALLATRELRDTGRLGTLEQEMARVLEVCGVPADPDLCAGMAAAEVALWRRSITLYDDAVPVLRALRGSGVPAVLVSNCQSWTRALVEDLGLDALVDGVILSCEVGVAKPDPGIFERALATVGVEPARALFVDDTVEFLDGAARLGIRTLELDRLGAHADSGHPRISSLRELPRWL